MFDMFKMMRNLPKLKESMEQLQQRLGQVVADGDAGAGMVKARCNGRLELVSCTLSEEALKLNDREMLEDLIKAAVNQALTKVRQEVAEETRKLTAEMGLPLPPGINLPGLT
jgi:DNA-binding YbaB/EbfC family protein